MHNRVVYMHKRQRASLPMVTLQTFARNDSIAALLLKTIYHQLGLYASVRQSSILMLQVEDIRSTAFNDCALVHQIE